MEQNNVAQESGKFCTIKHDMLNGYPFVSLITLVPTIPIFKTLHITIYEHHAHILDITNTQKLISYYCC